MGLYDVGKMRAFAFVIVPSLRIEMRRLSLLFAALSLATLLVGVFPEVILEVPGYGVLNGTEEESVYNSIPFYGFRSVFYAEMPTPETRFLVSLIKYSTTLIDLFI